MQDYFALHLRRDYSRQVLQWGCPNSSTFEYFLLNFLGYWCWYINFKFPWGGFGRQLDFGNGLCVGIFEYLLMLNFLNSILKGRKSNCSENFRGISILVSFSNLKLRYPALVWCFWYCLGTPGVLTFTRTHSWMTISWQRSRSKQVFARVWWTRGCGVRLPTVGEPWRTWLESKLRMFRGTTFWSTVDKTIGLLRGQRDRRKMFLVR